MSENMLNIEDMEVVLDDNLGLDDSSSVIIAENNPDEDIILDDDIFDSLLVQENETATIETKIVVPSDSTDAEELAVVYNLEGNTIQHYEVSQEKSESKPSTSIKRKLSCSGDESAVELPRSRQMGKIPIALRGLIGQAKMMMIQKNCSMAIQICINILKECPNASEPFFTLSDIYEQMGDMKKSLETAVIGSSLSSVTSEDWVLLGENCEANNMLSLTDFCLTKAIQKDKRNLDLHIKRASILEKLGTAKTILNEYDRLLRKLRPDQKDSILALSKLLIDSFVKENKYDRASNIMIYLFKKFPDDINPKDFSLCLDYLIKLKNYKKCFELLVEYYGFEFVADLHEGTSIITEVVECVVPPTMPVLVRVKLIETLIHLKAHSKLSNIYQPLLDLPMASQYHMDIANALFDDDQHGHAILFYEKLLKCNNGQFDETVIKIKYSDCLKTLGHLEKAVDNYNKLLESNPKHLKVKFDLYMSLKQLNKIGKSFEVLQNGIFDSYECRLLYEYAIILFDNDQKFDDCLRATKLMLSRHCVPINSLGEVKTMMAIQKGEYRHDALLIMKKVAENFCPETILTINPLPSAQDEWNLLIKICEKCTEKNNNYEPLKMLLSAINSTIFLPFNNQIILNSIKYAYKVRAYKLGFMLARRLLMKHPQAPQLANIYNFFFNLCTVKKQAKFIFRLAAKYPDNIALNILDTNVFNDSYNHQLVVSRYTELLSKFEDKSTLYFMLGVLVLRLCTFKVGTERHSLILQGIGFLMNYKDHRGEEHEQECYYNIARAYHEVGMVSKAIHYYKKVLELEPFQEDHCLKAAAAYNLYLIYKSSENYDVALMYLSYNQV
ncbi:general transcription factor 3C polypeptide 3 [Daktulosphaira vitifoliae]|uniref:general transcription factor 3C polypeptide 3 n=1 Tax=Daktulosphaira vitifoliae TaxID=58002 RepID=UPI0021AACA31|nr:general transcription factor 3C polypeptide 3 [Daktulosphaira vitifoliae]